MAGLSYKTLAALLGLRNSRAISRWEKGYTMPSACHLLKLSYLFKTLPPQLYPEYYQELTVQMQKKIIKMNIRLNTYRYRSTNDK